MVDRFFGLWISKKDNIQKVIDSGVWVNKLTNQKRVPQQMSNIKIGDKVFLFSGIEDVELEKTPYINYIDKNEYSVNIIVKVKSFAIGEVKRVDLENSSLYIKWDKSYTPNQWYSYYRQDGIWQCELKNNLNKNQKEKYLELYKMAFEGKQQDYKWWIDKGILNRYKKSNIQTKDFKISNINIKNIILYGSPGVGKTHNTNKLIRLIEDGKSDKEIFDTIKSNEPSDSVELSDMKERVKFVTFHQSFGYEDFVEGFRPNEDGNIELIKGIFREICIDAENNLLKSNENSEVPFIDAFNSLFKERIENEESITFPLKRANSFFKVYDYNDKTIYFEKQSGNTNHTLSIGTLEKMYKTEKNHFINGGLAVYYQPILNKLLEIKKETTIEKVERKNYYIVIDEINRANISKVFGELITLIEEDKRDTLEVTLPYSKQSFKIPSNLYIIGTMNSTDKSIALIDIALRRRFTFLKMKPHADLIDYPPAKEIFKKLNKRIKQDLGEDYQIGHSYFMKIVNEDDLAFVLEYKIIPLLEEYYYGDDRLIDVKKICKIDVNMDDDE